MQSKIQFIEDVELKKENDYLKKEIINLHKCIESQKKTIEFLHTKINVLPTIQPNPTK
jgi:hypothetical protein